MLIAGLLISGFGLLPVIVSRSYGAFFLIPFGAIFLLFSYFSYRSGQQIVAVEYRGDPGSNPKGMPGTSRVDTSPFR
jgi:hypothetical protein